MIRNSPVVEVNRGILRQIVILESLLLYLTLEYILTLHINMSVLNYGVHGIWANEQKVQWPVHFHISFVYICLIVSVLFL